MLRSQEREGWATNVLLSGQVGRLKISSHRPKRIMTCHVVA